MHRRTFVTPSERRSKLSKRPTPSGYSDPSSTMTERHPDTDTPELVGAWVNGRYYMGDPEGDAGEYLSADATVEIKHAR